MQQESESGHGVSCNNAGEAPDERGYIAAQIDRLYRQSIRYALAFGAAIFLCLGLMDFVSAPEHFTLFLQYRFAIVTILLGILIILDRAGARGQYALGYLAVLASAVTIELMIYSLEGHRSPYYAGMILLAVGVFGLVPGRTSFHLSVAATIYAVYLVPLLLFTHIADFRAFFISNVFMLSVIGTALYSRYVSDQELANQFSLKFALEESRVHLEKEVSARTAELSDTVKKIERVASEWRTTFDSTTDVIIMLNRGRRITRMNAATTRLLGRGFQDLLGMPVRELFSSSATGEAVEEAVELMEREKRREEREIPLGAGALWLLVSVDPILNAGGELLGAILILRDITGVKRSEEETMKLQSQLLQMQKLDSIGRLAGGIAHDFNNILSAIIGFSELAAKALPEGHPARDIVRNIEVTGHRGSELTRQLLIFSRKQSFEMRSVDLNWTIDSMGKLLARLIGDNVHLSLRTGNPVGPVLADPVQIEQILMNLAVNARDAMPDGGTLTIGAEDMEVSELSAARSEGVLPGNYVRISVADTGTGMPPEVKEKIFEPFFTTKEAGKGTGMGLAMVYGITKKHNGYIEVESAIGKGTNFFLYFPTTGGAIPSVSGGKCGSQVSSKGKETILVVDDDTAILRLVECTLKPLGYDVITASSGTEALEICDTTERGIHLLLSDIVMPGMNGKELAGLVRGKRPDVKLLFMSGYTRDIIVERGIVPEGIEFLPKPLTPIQLVSRIRQIFDGRGAEPACGEGVLGGRRILVAEDSEENRILMEHYLAGTGCSVDVVENGAAAVERVMSHRFDLVLMDMQMPVMNGFDAVRRIREWEESSGRHRLPVVALTAYAAAEDVEETLRAGCTAHLAKPMMRDQLLHLLSTCMSPAYVGGEQQIAESPRPVARIEADLMDIVPGYLEKTRENIGKMTMAIEAKDFEAIRILGHSLKGSGGGYGFDAITELGGLIERTAESHDLDAASGHVADLSRFLDEVQIVYQ